MIDDRTPNDQKALRFTDVDITRMEGIREGFRIDSVGADINLIHGPNGIGKSRTATGLQELIWPRSGKHGISLAGNLLISSDRWNVEIDLGRISWQKNDAPASGFIHATPPDSHRGRYYLTLQDLLQRDNNDLAEEIQIESSGGYNLAQVSADLNIPPPDRRFRPAKSANELRTIRDQLSKLRQSEKELRNEEQSLERLEAEHKKSIDAATRVDELRNAEIFQDALQKQQSAKLTFDAFPKTLHKMSGDEHSRSESLRQQLENLSEEHRKETVRAESLREEIAKTGFGDEIPPKTVITRLRHHLEEITKSDLSIAQIENQIAEIEATLTNFRNRLNQELTEEQMVHLDESGLRDLAALNREWHLARITAQTHAEVEEWLGPSFDRDRESLRRGVELLLRYLRIEGAGADGRFKQLTPLFLTGAAVLIALEAMILYASGTQFGLVFALAALPLIWLAFHVKSDPTEAESKKIQSEYDALGLIELPNWSLAGANQALESLQKLFAQAELDHERSLRWANLHDKRTRSETQVHAVSERLKSLNEKYGISLVEPNPESLDLLAKALEEWRRESDKLSKAHAQKSTLISQRQSALTECEAILRSHGWSSSVQNSADANAAIEDLDQRINDAHRVSAALEHTHHRLEKELSSRISEAESELTSIYQTLDLEPHDQRGLKQLTDQLEQFHVARINLRDAETAVSIARDRLRDGCGDEHLDHHEIMLAMEREAELANRRDDLLKEISRIKTEIDQAGHQANIESHLASELAALEKLAEGRAQDYVSAAKSEVFEFLQTRNREVNRPPVFRAANDLFVSFTNGEYRLGLDEAGSEFTALEANTGRAVSLENLSSGTRVQLLLAVRMAFIESSEQGVKLPLILDEVLGNTDDTRAKAIIEATLDIASRGRQVFYFTAQGDEIGKWTSALNQINHSLEWVVHDLAGIRGEPTTLIISDHVWDPSTFEKLDVHGDEDRLSLFEKLGKPTFDFKTATLAGLDLWYIIPDVSELAKLRKRGIERWGQYLNLYSGNHLKGVWDHALHEKASVRARAIEEFLNAWRVGRPAPFTITDLRECNLITDSFWERVVACAEQHSWNADAFVQALEQGVVSRFRRDTCEQLANWFRDNGFITPTPPLDDSLIRARVLSAVHDATECGVIHTDEIDQLLLEITEVNTAEVVA